MEDPEFALELEENRQEHRKVVKAVREFGTYSTANRTFLEIEPNDTVMEVVGPGMGIQRHYYFFRAACRPPSEEISVVRVAEISDQIWFDTNRFDAVAERLLQTGGGGFAFHIGAYRL